MLYAALDKLHRKHAYAGHLCQLVKHAPIYPEQDSFTLNTDVQALLKVCTSTSFVGYVPPEPCFLPPQHLQPLECHCRHGPL